MHVTFLTYQYKGYGSLGSEHMFHKMVNKNRSIKKKKEAHYCITQPSKHLKFNKSKLDCTFKSFDLLLSYTIPLPNLKYTLLIVILVLSALPV